MTKIESLLKSLNAFIEKEDDDIADLVTDFPGLEKIQDLVEEYEKIVARLLREQRKWYLDAFDTFVSKSDSITLEAFLLYLKGDLFAADDFVDEFGDETASFLQMTTEELAKVMMESIDPDVIFEVLSEKTTNWIKNWSTDLADIMELTTHEALEKELLDAISDGDSIADVELRMKDMPQFDRNRARTTARTEILTASSRAHWESFMQSPSVVMKKWKHSGTKNIDARETHIAMDGVEIPVNDYFQVDGEEGLFPRDPSFSPKNRVNCGCVLGPVVDEDILRLSKEEKEAMRQEALDELAS
ncbi:phage minor head protein [Lentibacillus sp. N15]|uniref:phage minor head protein n=1 Tax=Lentibacillus songyuanensis TaxID=3136161 RepID=UPI0031B9FF58